jgi:hypothetical protein
LGIGAITGTYATYTGTSEIDAAAWNALTPVEKADMCNVVYVNAFNEGMATIGATPLDGVQSYTDGTNMEALVEVFATSLDTYYCKCADGSEDFRTTGCCLSSGGAGLDFTGFGCLQGLPGWFESDGNLADDDLTETMVRTEAREAATGLTVQDYCPDDPAKMAEYVQYEGETDFSTNYEFGAASISFNTSAPLYTETVNGGNAKYVTPQGLTGKAGDNFVTAKGTKPSDDLTLFVSQISRSLTLEYYGDSEMDENFNTAEYRPNAKLLWSSTVSGDADALKKLEGDIGSTFPLSFEGVANTAPIQTGGLPVYLSQVNYLNADPALLSNGIEMYHCFAYPESIPYPGTDGQAEPAADPVDSGVDAYGNTKVVDVSKCTRIDEDFLVANKDDLDVWVQVEPATGITVAGHQRLMASIAPTIDCNPFVFGNHDIFQVCALGYSGSGDFGACHKDYVAAVEGIEVSGVAAGDMIKGAMAMKGLTYDAGFPCSSANVFTPGFNGGGLVPSWYIDRTSEAGPNARKFFVDLGKFLAFCGTISMAGIAVGAIILIIGVACVVGCGKSKVAASA